jgi:hypothetical protein
VLELTGKILVNEEDLHLGSALLVLAISPGEQPVAQLQHI